MSTKLTIDEIIERNKLLLNNLIKVSDSEDNYVDKNTNLVSITEKVQENSSISDIVTNCPKDNQVLSYQNSTWQNEDFTVSNLNLSNYDNSISKFTDKTCDYLILLDNVTGDENNINATNNEITELNNGQIFLIKPIYTNTDIPRLKINNLTTIPIYKNSEILAKAGDIISNNYYLLLYSDLKFIILSSTQSEYCITSKIENSFNSLIEKNEIPVNQYKNIAIDVDEDFYIAYSANNGIVIKSLYWSKIFTGKLSSEISLKCHNNNIYLAYTYNDNVICQKIDKNGNILYSYLIRQKNSKLNRNAIAIDDEDNIYIAYNYDNVFCTVKKLSSDNKIDIYTCLTKDNLTPKISYSDGLYLCIGQEVHKINSWIKHISIPYPYESELLTNSNGVYIAYKLNDILSVKKLNSKNGYDIWTKQFQEYKSDVTLASDNTGLYVNFNSFLYKLNQTTGDLISSGTNPDLISTPIIKVFNNKIYLVGGTDKKIICYIKNSKDFLKNYLTIQNDFLPDITNSYDLYCNTVYIDNISKVEIPNSIISEKIKIGDSYIVFDKCLVTDNLYSEYKSNIGTTSNYFENCYATSWNIVNNNSEENSNDFNNNALEKLNLLEISNNLSIIPNNSVDSVKIYKYPTKHTNDYYAVDLFSLASLNVKAIQELYEKITFFQKQMGEL